MVKYSQGELRKILMAELGPRKRKRPTTLAAYEDDDEDEDEEDGAELAFNDVNPNPNANNAGNVNRVVRVRKTLSLVKGVAAVEQAVLSDLLSPLNAFFNQRDLSFQTFKQCWAASKTDKDKNKAAAGSVAVGLGLAVGLGFGLGVPATATATSPATAPLHFVVVEDSNAQRKLLCRRLSQVRL